MAIKLKYIGDKIAGREGDFLPGVPASDHEVETEKEAKERVASGLYKIEKATGGDG